MQSVKMLADVVDVARRAADRWYVTTGNTAVGPVNLELLTRGVEAGKVPLEAFVRHEEWKVWRPLSELAVILGDDGVACEAPPQSGVVETREAEASEATDDISDFGQPLTQDDLAPSDALDGAADRRDALILMMTAAVVRGGADAAIVHEIDDDGAVAVCAHGPATWEAVGLRTPASDPAVVAAHAGGTIVAEPDPGPAGAAIIARLAKLEISTPLLLEGALMIPMRVPGRLLGMIEIGRQTPFRSSEIASLEALVEALVHKLEGWRV